jgi:hypothetical protein
MTVQSNVTRVLVPEDRRLAVTEKLFGMHFPLRLEPLVYTITERLTKDYQGGYWNFYTLSNGGFYMAPAGDRNFHVMCDNHFEGDLSADALGIVSCLYTFSNLSFAGPDAFADICSDHYYWLREFMLEHSEAEAILGATD